MQKFPYIIIVGEQEQNDNTISVRQHGGSDLGTLSVAEFTGIIKKKVNESLNIFK